MSNIENNDNNDTKEILEEVTPSVSTGNDGIESSEISELATTEVVKAEATEEVAPTVSSTNDEKIEYIQLFEEGLKHPDKMRKFIEFTLSLVMRDCDDLKNRDYIKLTPENSISKKIFRNYLKEVGNDEGGDWEETELDELINHIAYTRSQVLSQYGCDEKGIIILSFKAQEEANVRRLEKLKKHTSELGQLTESIKETYNVNLEITKEHILKPEKLEEYIHTSCSHLHEKYQAELIAIIGSAKNILLENDFDKYIIPEGYKVDFDNGIQKVEIKTTVDKKGISRTWEACKTICYRPVYINTKFKNFNEKQKNKDEKIYLGIVVFDTNGYSKEVIVTREDLFNKKKLLGLIEKGLLITDEFVSSLAKFFTAYYNENENKLGSGVFAERNGWNSDFTRFVVGDRVYFEGGFEDIHIPENYRESVTRGFTSKGDIKEFERLTKSLFNNNSYRHLSYIAILALVLEIIGAESILINIYSQSAVGKTTICRLVMTQYGFVPERGENGLSRPAAGSEAGIEALLHNYNDLPIFFDEKKNEDGNEKNSNGLSVYNAVSGLSRNLANKDNTVKKSRDHINTVLITSEYPIVNENDQRGKQARTRFHEAEEYIPKLDPKDVINLDIAMSDHYGLFIETIMETIFKHKNELKELYHAYQLEIIDKEASKMENRISKFYASIMIGGFLFEKTLERLNEKYGTTFEVQDFKETEREFLKTEFNENPVTSLEKITIEKLWYTVGKFRESSFADEIPKTGTRMGWIEYNSHTGRNELLVLKGALKEILKDKKESFSQMCKAWNQVEAVNPYPRGGRNTYVRDKLYESDDGKRIKEQVVVFYIDKIYEILDIDPSEFKKPIDLDGEGNDDEFEIKTIEPELKKSANKIELPEFSKTDDTEEIN